MCEGGCEGAPGACERRAWISHWHDIGHDPDNHFWPPRLVGSVPAGLPGFTPPPVFDLDLVVKLLNPTLVVGLFAYILSMSIVRTMAIKYDYSTDSNQEVSHPSPAYAPSPAHTPSAAIPPDSRPRSRRHTPGSHAPGSRFLALSATQLIAFGMANVVGSCFAAYPGDCNPPRDCNPRLALQLPPLLRRPVDGRAFESRLSQPPVRSHARR